MASKKRNELSLKQKVDLLKNSEGKSSRQLAEAYGVGRTQVQNIMKRKHEILNAFEYNCNRNRKRLCVSTANADINELMWQWFLRMRCQRIPVSGAMMQETALLIAKQLNLADFKASTGWLRSFKARHGLSMCFGGSGYLCDISSHDELDDDIPLDHVTNAADHLKIKDPRTVEELVTADDKTTATEEYDSDQKDHLVTNINHTERPVSDSVQESKDDEPECLIKTMAEALKWTSQLKQFFFSKGLTKNYHMAMALEFDLHDAISSSTLGTKQPTINSFFKKSV